MKGEHIKMENYLKNAQSQVEQVMNEVKDGMEQIDQNVEKLSMCSSDLFNRKQQLRNALGKTSAGYPGIPSNFVGKRPGRRNVIQPAYTPIDAASDSPPSPTTFTASEITKMEAELLSIESEMDTLNAARNREFNNRRDLEIQLNDLSKVCAYLVAPMVMFIGMNGGCGPDGQY